MTSGKSVRRLTTIVAADVAGYSRLTANDEEGTIAAFRSHRTEFIDPKIDEYRGRLANTAGDSLLIEFPSVVEALRFAMDMQSGMQERNLETPEDRRIVFRIGVNIGDVIEQDGDLLGDGVNVAARLEGLADPGGICISRSARDQVRDRMDIALEDMGEVPVKNIARPVRTFRVLRDGQAIPSLPRFAFSKSWPAMAAAALFVVLAGSGAWWWQPWSEGGTPADGSRPTLSLSQKPSIAVLPFANLSGDPQQDYFSNGITEDILTALARVPGFFVPAGNSTRRYKGKSVDLRKVGRELGVRYVLEGSVQKSGDQVRVTAQLIEIEKGSHIWAERYDRPLTDIFAVQDEITEAIATRLVAQIKRADLAVARRKPTERMDAYDLVLQARDSTRRRTAEGVAEAQSLYERAISYDPNYADAYAGLASVYVTGFIYGWGELTGPPALDKAIELGQRSVALDPDGGFAAYTLALPYIFRRRLDEAEAVLARAHAAYPNDADVMDRLGVTYVFQGRAQEGLALLERVLEVDPFHRRAIYAFIARGHVMLKNYDKAAEQLKLCYAEAARFRVCYEVAAVFYAETGQIEKAREAVATLRRIDPAFTLTSAPVQLPFKNKADQDRFIDAFRKAGMPE